MECIPASIDSESVNSNYRAQLYTKNKNNGILVAFLNADGPEVYQILILRNPVTLLYSLNK